MRAKFLISKVCDASVAAKGDSRVICLLRLASLCQRHGVYRVVQPAIYIKLSLTAKRHSSSSYRAPCKFELKQSHSEKVFPRAPCLPTGICEVF